MRWPREPLKVARWERGDSYIEVVTLSRNVIAVDLHGTATRDALDVVLPQLGELFAGSDQCQSFWNTADFQGFDPEFRDGVLALLKQHRSRWVKIHTLVKSALIGMTVTTIGLLFLGAIKSYRDLDDYLASLQRALEGSGD
ncbi:hypothetical protein [Paraliomyxa miuraensis]|uniref:hypothetical protein n=1 Tax=Paraliomyxa miuraensis TaxID=376150 RepID=UPI002255A376|nr:hypothetical protein [Paraliomyxa miuraensis]MCX4241267.1 hypothetical protein [Paraliomyxa miuraensis]